MEGRSRNIVKYLLSLAVAAVLLYFSFRGVKWADLLAALGACRWGFVLLAMAVGALAFGLRALRWRMLLHPIDPSSRGFVAELMKSPSSAPSGTECGQYQLLG